MDVAGRRRRKEAEGHVTNSHFLCLCTSLPLSLYLQVPESWDRFVDKSLLLSSPPYSYTRPKPSPRGLCRQLLAPTLASTRTFIASHCSHYFSAHITVVAIREDSKDQKKKKKSQTTVSMKRRTEKNDLGRTFVRARLNVRLDQTSPRWKALSSLFKHHPEAMVHTFPIDYPHRRVTERPPAVCMG